jgi:hypothetical protein
MHFEWGNGNIAFKAVAAVIRLHPVNGGSGKVSAAAASPTVVSPIDGGSRSSITR